MTCQKNSSAKHNTARNIDGQKKNNSSAKHNTARNIDGQKKKAKKKFGKKKFPSAMTLMSHYSIHDLKSKTGNRPSLLTSRRCLMTSPWRRAANEKRSIQE
jgi:hypothetical protein